ncbi:MAG: hypothetical protein PHE32_02360 [Candidatus Shapirobacteria bacterium]|nr:hypothetical protein [Candidatus Shapirobacteria bacterium]MDD4410514.1 hypothetical protein [Candidatus Shapirobacteria bacterium]
MISLLNHFWNVFGNKHKLNILIRKKINNLLDTTENFVHPNLKKTFDKKTNNVKKILLFAYGTTGDIAIFSSFTKYLKKLFPNSKIFYIVNNIDKVIYISSLDKNIDEIITIDIPRFFTFKIIDKIKKKYPDYDLFINLNLYPNLRHLMSYVKFIEMPYFLFKKKPDNLPTPKLYLDFKIRQQKIIFLNLEMISLNFDNNYLQLKEMEEIIFFLANEFKKYQFVVNNYLELANIKTIKNVKLFHGNYKELVKIATSSKIFISSRNGLCDVIAASVSNKPMFIIYPNLLFPGKNGTEFVYTYGMKDIGYPNPIEETIFNRNINGVNRLKKQIKTFIENNYEKQY